MEEYYLQRYIYSGDEEIIREAEAHFDMAKWEKWHYAVMIESGSPFFENANQVDREIREGLRREFFYLNLNTRQSLLLFEDVYCDYKLIVNQIWLTLRRKYAARSFFAISRKFDGYKDLPGILSQLEQQMEERFYHPEKMVFTADEDKALSTYSEIQDSMLIDKISEDVSRKDTENLWEHFALLREKYSSGFRYSAMYVKFVFSRMIQELYTEEQFAEEHDLTSAVTRLYKAEGVDEILQIAEENIREYVKFINESMSALRMEIQKVKDYIQRHCTEEVSPEMLSDKVHLSVGFLSFIFKKETGMSIARYMKVCRMEKARQELESPGAGVKEAAKKAGFENEEYFRMAVYQYTGKFPEEFTI